jgi:hypothetical protein
MMVLEELHGALVPLSRGPTPKCAKILAPTRARISLAGIKAVLPVPEFPNHAATYFTS